MAVKWAICQVLLLHTRITLYIKITTGRKNTEWLLPSLPQGDPAPHMPRWHGPVYAHYLYSFSVKSAIWMATPIPWDPNHILWGRRLWLFWVAPESTIQRTTPAQVHHWAPHNFSVLPLQFLVSRISKACIHGSSQGCCEIHKQPDQKQLGKC